MFLNTLISKHNVISISRWGGAKYSGMPHQYVYLRAGGCYAMHYILHMHRVHVFEYVIGTHSSMGQFGINSTPFFTDVTINPAEFSADLSSPCTVKHESISVTANMNPTEPDHR